MPDLSPAYKEIKRLRSNGRSAAAMAALRSTPPASDRDALEAVVCLFVCGDVPSAANVCRTYAWKKTWAREISAAFAESVGGDASRALALGRKALAAPGVPYDAVALSLLLLQASGNLEEADAYVRNRLPNPPVDETFLMTIVAEIAMSSGRQREAYRAASAVLSADPEDYRALLVLSMVNHEIGNFHEALGIAVRAEMTRKGSAPAILQLMRGHNGLRNHYAAIGAFDMLAAHETVTPAIRVELGHAYSGLEDFDRAAAEYRSALATGSRPVAAIRGLVTIGASGGPVDLHAVVEAYRDHIYDDLESVHTLGREALNRGDVAEAARLFARTHVLAVRSGVALRDLPWPVPEPRIRHDREQLQLLERRGKLDGAGRDALRLLERQGTPETAPEATFAPAEAEALRSALCTCFYVPDPPFAGRALVQNDYAAIEERYLADRLAVIDDFLSPEALESLRRYCEEATVWKINYERGYLGVLLAQGFSPRVLLAIARELKDAMPRVIGGHPLMQAWAYKYDQRLQGINMHADYAKVNVNFWITPDDACEDPTRGGMVVYDVPVPRHWTFFEYNNEPEKLAVYVKVRKANAQRVPYRANRCVVFDSGLVHKTDDIHFKPGYENRRVNVTLLYGTPRTVD